MVIEQEPASTVAPASYSATLLNNEQIWLKTIKV